MRTKSEVLMETFGTTDIVACNENMDRPPPPFDKYITMKLPYEASEHPPLPSLDELERVMERDYPLSLLGATCRMGNCHVIRSWNPIILSHAENKLFLEKHSQVRTPKVYAVFKVPLGDDTDGYKDGYKDCYYVISEYIEGETWNEDKWLALDDEAQRIICSKLSEQIKLLRSVPKPSKGYYGRVHHQPWSPWFFFLCTDFTDMCGPHETYEKFASAMFTSTEVKIARGIYRVDHHPTYLPYLLRLKPGLLEMKGQEPVLTQPDLDWRNLIFRPIKQGGEIVDWEVVVKYWNDLGWMPAWMQFVTIPSKVGLWGDIEQRKLFLQRVFAPFQETYAAERDFMSETSKKLSYFV